MSPEETIVPGELKLTWGLWKSQNKIGRNTNPILSATNSTNSGQIFISASTKGSCIVSVNVNFVHSLKNSYLKLQLCWSVTDGQQLVTVWWQLQMLVTECCRPTLLIVKSVTNTSNSSSKWTVTNIRHQHRCCHQHGLPSLNYNLPQYLSYSKSTSLNFILIPCVGLLDLIVQVHFILKNLIVSGFHD